MIFDLPSLLAAATRHGLQLNAEAAELDESGADFIVAQASDEAGIRWIIRSPRRPDVLERAETERRALEVLAPRLPVAIPSWRVFTHELIAYPLLPGNPAAVIDMNAGGYVWRFESSAPPRTFTESLGRAIAAVHAVPISEAERIGLRTHCPEDVRRELAHRMDRAKEVVTVPDGIWRRWQDWIADDTYWPEKSTVVHGDLHPAHILVDEEHRVSGLLDWTEAHVGDPATDFTIQYATMGKEALGALLAAYSAAGGQVGPRMLDHIAESWLAYPATVATFALVTGEDSHRQLAQMLIDSEAGGAGPT